MRAILKVRDLFAAPDIDPATHARAYDAIHQVRLVTALTMIALSWVLPRLPRRDRVVMTALVCLFYLPLALFLRRLSSKSDRLPARMLAALSSLATLGLFSFLMPETIRVPALLGYGLVIAIHTLMGGVGVGLVMVPASVGMVVATESFVPAQARLSPFEITSFGVVLAGLALVLHGSIRQRQMSAFRLSRLLDALGALSSHPELAETLESVAAAAKEAVGATFVAALLKDSDRLKSGAVVGVEADAMDDTAGMTQAALAFPDRSPSGTALNTGELVVVQDIATDEKFSSWAGAAKTYGFQSMVVVPLLSDGEAIGVLNAYFSRKHAVHPEDIELLSAFAAKASILISRAIVYERQKQTAIELKEAGDLKSEFIATVSHELRTPLTITNGMLETVVSRGDQLSEETRREFLGRSLAAANQMHRMIEQLLVFSGVESGSLTVDLEDSSLCKEVQEFLRDFRVMPQDHLLEVDVPSDIYVSINRDAFSHILSNLLSNAAKYSAPGSPIRLTAACENGTAVVSIRDQGNGIQTSELPLIFEPFYRGGGVGVRPGGAGVGLAVVRRYVALMGGKAWVDSEVGVGSTFSFTLKSRAASGLNAKAS